MNLAGFKSFADRTRLEFEPGVSVVVGPNGVGKSNLVDAVAWVLGSRFTKALRTDRMDDVIFAGTAARPPHGRAEVTIVFDNARRLLPVELDEVSLTRRLFRGGLSQYEINGVQCRLLDVQELLADGGIGRHQHLIVGQGRLDSILTADREHRRRIIEEAAGILKHRLRKERAIRRLEETDQDVTRLHDVLREIKRHRRPLQRQLAAARRYELVRDELRALRLWLGGEGLRASRRRLQEIELEANGLHREIEEKKAHLDRCKENLDSLGDGRRLVGESLERATSSKARLESVTTRLHGIAQVARERVNGLSFRIEGARERRTNLEEEAARLADQVADAQEQEQEVRKAVEDAQAALDLHSERLRSLTPDDHDAVESELSSLEAEILRLEADAQRDRGVRVNLLASVDESRVRIAEESVSLGMLEDELDTTTARLEASRRASATCNASRSELEAVHQAAELRLRGATTRRIESQARMEALEGKVAPPDGDPTNGYRDWDGVEGRLVGLLDLPDHLVAAAEAALGAWSDGVVLPDPEAMREALGRPDVKGQVEIPLLHGEAPPGPVDSRSVAQAAGVESLVDILGSSTHRDLAGRLLGDVVLVTDWRAGLDIVRANPEIRAVTADGRLITSFGICPARPNGVSRSDLEAARRELDTACSIEADAERAASSSAERLEEARRAEDKAQRECAFLRGERSRITGEMERVRRSIAAAKRNMARLDARLDTVAGAITETERRSAELLRRSASLKQAAGDSREARRRLLAQRSEIDAERQSAERARDEAIGRLGAASERQRFLSARVEGVRRELDQLGDPAAVIEELEATTRVQRHARRAGGVIDDKVRGLEGRIARLRDEVASSDSEIAEARRVRLDLERSVEDYRTRSAALAVEGAELRVREESLLESLRRDADATGEQALGAAPPPNASEDHREREDRLAAELSRLGPVNLLAAEEFRELDERFRLIKEQLEDIERSRVALGKVIKNLDNEMSRRFSATFEQVARHYAGFFSELFPGGTGRLTLTDTENPLGAGVEMTARPLGKKVGKLALLSGGERSLAALAFLFAVFKARPGPFYILDEVDAALDDANLQRFLRLVDGFRNQAQLIVITHQQATVRAADVLYGITMAPGGSSQALVHRLEEASASA